MATTQASTDTSTLPLLLIGFAALAPVIAWRGYVAWCMYDWLILPYGAPPITLGMACIVEIGRAFFLPQKPDATETFTLERLLTLVVEGFVGGLFWLVLSYAAAYIIHGGA